MMIKGSVCEDCTIVNTYASYIRKAKDIKEIPRDLKGVIDISVIVEDFNTLLSTMDKSSRQKINKETLDLNYTLHQMGQTDISRTFPPTAAESTFF